MKIIDMEEFFMTTWHQGWPPRMNMKLYDGDLYECVCGSSHEFHHSRVARELPKMHVVIECPRDVGLVCVKIKGIFSTKLVSQFGALGESAGRESAA
jgi:hypothetical protein